MTKTSRPSLSRPAPPSSGVLFDELLVVMVQQGDRRALDRLHMRWDTRLIRAAYRYTGDADLARDLAQDCWIGIWKGIAGLRNPARFRSYAFAILHRRGASHVRSSIRDRDHVEELSQETAQTASQDGRIAIQQAFAALPPDQRLAAHLHFVEGLTLAEIAEVQSIPTGTAKSRLFHARRKLKAALNPDCFEGELP
ncbi:RNA polymerase sigma factor [Erythrobacter crassostreae]|uniref:RNA polymerase sigma factor n=1 Tax=Erythrobacter crassostreae TaxID=2828328 RepID=A0A9X1F4W4_9SPHN|nr:RNA polymerase sigma factor [Erythrobacter crassostrea]MBV7259383.1 RNA polymerase sigma factor [Erythrobacter crassostrea]